MLDRVAAPEWQFVRDAGVSVVPFEIDDTHLDQLDRVTDGLSTVAAQLAAPGQRLALVYVSWLGNLRPPPRVSDDVLCWVGAGEGGTMAVLPDGTWAGGDKLESHVRAVLARERD